MKKIIALLLLISMVITLCSCGDSNQQNSNKEKSIQLGEAVTAGNWEFTLMDIQFASDIGNYDEYENYLVPGGKTSNANPFALEDGEMFAVVTYKLKNIGKESLSVRDSSQGISVGTGKFVYSDGYTFHRDTSDSIAQAHYYDGSGFNSTSFLVCEPLSNPLELRVAFCVPAEVVENTSEPLVYEIKFNEDGNNMVLKYTIR